MLRGGVVEVIVQHHLEEVWEPMSTLGGLEDTLVVQVADKGLEVV